jgi:hypothetical protein
METMPEQMLRVAGEQELPYESELPAPRRTGHFLIFRSTPAAAKVNLNPG